MSNLDLENFDPDLDHDEDLVQCQGCGAYANGAQLGKPHNCFRLQDGTYEEGGTFQ